MSELGLMFLLGSCMKFGLGTRGVSMLLGSRLLCVGWCLGGVSRSPDIDRVDDIMDSVLISEYGNPLTSFHGHR